MRRATRTFRLAVQIPGHARFLQQMNGHMLTMLGQINDSMQLPSTDIVLLDHFYQLYRSSSQLHTRKSPDLDTNRPAYEQCRKVLKLYKLDSNQRTLFRFMKHVLLNSFNSTKQPMKTVNPFAWKGSSLKVLNRGICINILNNTVKIIHTHRECACTSYIRSCKTFSQLW